MKSKQTVVLQDEVVREIQRRVMEKGEPVLGAVQRTLARGAELALAELRGNSSVNVGDIHPTAEVSMVKTTIDSYNSLRVVETARKTANSLRDLAAELEAAMGDDVNARTTTADDEQRQALNLARSERAAQLVESARAAQEQHRRNKADFERGKRGSDSKASGGAA